MHAILGGIPREWLKRLDLSSIFAESAMFPVLGHAALPDRL